jgi:predicted acylesterase/phospholipase RssA
MGAYAIGRAEYVTPDARTERESALCLRFTMKKLGLALSGGGFRASLFHLGLLRFLRDAGILSQVTHITSVSGGSIMAAHLILNWDRYNGGTSEFDAAAAEFLSFVRLDVRNRIVRRFPLTNTLRLPYRLLGRSVRRLTRSGLLEYHYERHLYGDKSLFELPEKPQLHILATNLSEGCLCSFNRNGLLMVRRQPGGTFRLDRVHAGLATVAMAVAASSAFPGFFPPLELTGAEVGADAGEFGRQAYTDGGVFDNLGVRMFHCLERSLLADRPLCRTDFVDFQATIEALLEASKSSNETPLRRLAQILLVACRQPDLLLLPAGAASNGPATAAAVETGPPARLPQPPDSSRPAMAGNEDIILSALSNILRHYQFGLDPLFAGLKPMKPAADALLRASRLSGQALGAADHFWLNRHLLEAAFRQATGRACFRRISSGLDGVLVSDVGKPMEVQSNRRAGGLIRTAMRASDILMDRVWQLEIESFQDMQGFVFAAVTDVVEPPEDPTALHPEIQRRLATIRTDLDRFSPLEISSLVRHGYCVGRKACRAHTDLFGADLPAEAPWEPIAAQRSTTLAIPVLGNLKGSTKAPAAATTDARTLQGSSVRSIWSTLLDRRDWVSYVYVPIIMPILVLLPYVATTTYRHSHRLSQIVKSFSQSTSDLDTLNEMLENKSVAWSGEHAQRVRSLDEPNLQGFQILQDSRIFDLRAWQPRLSGAQDSAARVYRRLKVVKQSESMGNNLLRLHLLPTSPKTLVRFPAQQLQPRLRMSDVEGSVPGQEECRWEVSFDFQGVPPGEFVDLIVEELSPGQYLEGGQNASAIPFLVQAETAELTTWILMPKGREYRNFRISRHETGKPEKSESVRVVTEYLAEDFTILAFKLLALKPGWTYAITWLYK